MIEVVHYKSIPVAQILSTDIVISEIQDAVDIMAEALYLGANRIILNDYNIIPAFFDLKSLLAGDILQKFSNYRVSLAIVGDFTKYQGKAIKEFIFESNRTGQILFVKTLEEAKEHITR
jgi:hypothetical protein